jgi:hypothetical protein
MPIRQVGWELLIQRLREDNRNGRLRTVGGYQVFHDGVATSALSGACAETRGPGDNSKAGNNRRIEAGRYPLSTHDGEKYLTIGYAESASLSALPRPALEVGHTNKRVGILIHPGRGFLSSIGCINPARALPRPDSDIDFVDSRKRVIAMIDDMRTFLGGQFPTANGRDIPNAWCVIDGEP